MSATLHPSSPSETAPVVGTPFVRPGLDGEAAACLAVARVLVIDDELLNLRTLSRLLEAAGVGAVVGCSEPAEALAMVQTVRPDLVLLDLHMPEVDGFAILEQLPTVRHAGEFLPVLVLTGDSSREARTRALAAGANDFLTKPFDRYEVELRVRNLLLMRAWQETLRCEAAALEATVEAKTRDLRAALQRAESAAAAKSAFLATMSHELRTPLTAIIGFAQVLGKNKLANLTTEDLSYAARIEANGRHLLTLLNDILDLARVEAGKLPIDSAPVPIDALLRHVTSAVHRMGDHGGEVPVHIAMRGDVAARPVVADPTRLAQILINLVGNAVKFTAPVRDGVVVVKAFLTNAGNVRRIDVLDSGIGMSAEQRARVFDDFEQGDRTTARRFGGAGLGLSIARALAEAMGFRVTVASREGEGACFSLLLDRAESPYRSLEEARAARAEAGSLAEQLVARELVIR